MGEGLYLLTFAPRFIMPEERRVSSNTSVRPCGLRRKRLGIESSFGETFVGTT